MVLALAAVVFRRYRTQPKLFGPAVLLIGLLVAQLTLGVLTVLLRKPADVASAHVAVGALVLVTSFSPDRPGRTVVRDSSPGQHAG